ncbi:MAG: hypothetical protein ACJ76N_07920 [Thermoanaerobaculia bacterium]
MDESPKPPDAASLVAELQQALDGSARCIELAKRETARIEASLLTQALGEAQSEQELLDNARKRREQLRLLDPQELAPAPDLGEVSLLSSEEVEAADSAIAILV